MRKIMVREYVQRESERKKTTFVFYLLNTGSPYSFASIHAGTRARASCKHPVLICMFGSGNEKIARE